MALRVPPGVNLWFYTVADLDALIAAAVEARAWLGRTWPASPRCRCRPRQPVPDAGPAAGGGGVMRTATAGGTVAVVTGLRWWAPVCSATRPPSSCSPSIGTVGTSGPASPG